MVEDLVERCLSAFACRAGDAHTYRKLRKQIGEQFYEDAWPSNYTMEVCDERLLKKR